MGETREDDESKPLARFPKRVYTYDEVRLARSLIDRGYRHHLRVMGSEVFREKAREALRLVKTAGYYDFLRTYIRAIREIEGLSQLREAEASLWVNIYGVQDALDAACFFIQKARQMKSYIEGKTYYGHRGEAVAVDACLEFLETLARRSKDPKIREKSQRKIEFWKESMFL